MADLDLGLVRPPAYTGNPAMDGTASPGSSDSFARGDHVHSTDTSREASGLGITGASVGDLVRVNAVDANGKPTSWKKAPLCEIKTNPNLLDNWYFVGGWSGSYPSNNYGIFPVNQRKQTSYSNAGYCIDRWKLTSGSLSVASGGITLNGTITQILPASIGHSVTASALLSDGSMITPTYNDSTKTFTLTATGQTIVAAKLEIGETQTLAHYDNESEKWVINEIPNYAEELSKCEAYYFLVSNYEAQFVGVGSGTDLKFLIPLPVTMAGTPTVTLPSTLTVAYSNGSETIGAGRTITFTQRTSRLFQGAIRINLTLSSAILNMNYMCSVLTANIVLQYEP